MEEANPFEEFFKRVMDLRETEQQPPKDQPPQDAPPPPPPKEPDGDKKVVLLLTSHAHSPPLLPPPNLKFDLRCVENPPKKLRDTQTGLSKQLREHLLGHTDFVSLLERAEGEIKAAIAEMDAVDANSSPEAETNEERALSVSVFCARGQHRSVAFVEELAKRAWKCDVRVAHRDLGKERRDKKGRDKGRDRGGFGIANGEE
ncbi:hypothetical protein OQA88_1760 [Cercophora sp. LCS_1]